jgi:hypothetical protein
MAFRIRLRSRPPHYLKRWPQVSRLRIDLPESPVAQLHYVSVVDVRVEEGGQAHGFHGSGWKKLMARKGR